MPKEEKKITLKIYIASHFPNRSMLNIVKRSIENTEVSRIIDKVKYIIIFDIISSWLLEEKDLHTFDSIICGDYEQIDNSNIIMGFWPWGAGTVSELSYAIRRYKNTKDIFLYVDPWMLDVNNNLNILKPSPEYFSLMTPFALLRKAVKERDDHYYNFEEDLKTCDTHGFMPYENDKNILAIGSSPLGLESFLSRCSSSRILKKKTVSAENIEEELGDRYE